MSGLIQGNPWIWVVVQDPGGDEQFLGQHDEEKQVSFIPCFLEKEQAQQCLHLMARDRSLKYEVQAIEYEEIGRHAEKNGFLLFLLNQNGEILEKISPKGVH